MPSRRPDLTTLEEWTDISRREGWDRGIPPEGLLEIRCITCDEVYNTFPHWGARRADWKKRKAYRPGVCSDACEEERQATKVEHALRFGPNCHCRVCRPEPHPSTLDIGRFPQLNIAETL